MASANPFDLLGDDDNDDPSHLIAVYQQKNAAKKSSPNPASQAPAKLPTKPLPPAQAVREARAGAASSRGGGGRGAQGRSWGGRGVGPRPNMDFGNGNVDGFSGSYGGGRGGQDGEAGKPLDKEHGPSGGSRQPYGSFRRGGYENGEARGDLERPPRRVFERRSGTGCGTEFKREGAGRGNWGSPTDDVNIQESEVQVDETNRDNQENVIATETNKDSKEAASNESEVKEQEEKEMTLDEYEKIKLEKRKALLSLKTTERKVDLDKEFQSMQQLSIKKGNDDVFTKLGSDRDPKKAKRSC